MKTPTLWNEDVSQVGGFAWILYIGLIALEHIDTQTAGAHEFLDGDGMVSLLECLPSSSI